MRFESRILTMLASFLFILMMAGCDSPAGSSDPSGSHGTSGSANSLATLEQTFVDERGGESIGATGEPIGEEVGSESAALAASGTSSDSNFGDGAGIDDPFAVIGSAFSGLAAQSFSSNCDPFEDTYGTCL